MLTASILKIFYWPGARYDAALLIQAVVMVGVQVVLLKVALDNRPSQKDAGPFQGLGGARPYKFWRWRSQRPYVSHHVLQMGPESGRGRLLADRSCTRYWEYLALLTLALLAFQTFLQPGPSSSYTQLIGYMGLATEAILPIPQILANHRAQSCKGFRVSVLANWLLGDAMKMGFFFLAEEGKIPWAFKLCGIFQAACDVGLGIQYWMFGDESKDALEKIEKG